jgi:hypothetical protein
MAQKYASMAAKDTRENSTLFDNVDATITNIQLTKEAPDNYEAAGSPIFGVVSLLLDGDGPEDDRKQTQSYSLGAKAGEEFTISQDGYGLIPTSDDFVATRKGSKWDAFKSSLENEGVPSTVFEAGDMSKLIGLRGHFKRVNDPERNFGEGGGKRKESKFKPQTLLCVKLLSLPGEKAVGKTNGAAVTIGGGAGASVAPDGDLDTVTGIYMLDVLAGAKDKRVQRSQLTLLLSKAAMKDPRRQDIARRGADEAFIATLVETGLVVYDPAAKPQYVTAAA